MRCIRAGPDFIDDPERYGRSGATVIELPLEMFPGVNPGKLRLLADRAGLRTLATVSGLEGPGRALLEKAVQARLDHIELPLETDVELRGRVLAQARKTGVKVVLSHRTALPPRSAESVLRIFQKCSRAGGDLCLASFQVQRADHVRMLLESSAAAREHGIPHGLAATGGLAPLVPLIGADLVYGKLDGGGDGLDIGLLSGIGRSTRLYAMVGEPARPDAAPGLVNRCLRALGQDGACLKLQPGPDGPGALSALLVEMGFFGFLVGRPFRTRLPAPAPDNAAGAVSVVTVRNGSLAGHDTDGEALLEALDRSGVRVQRRRALVLGTGGAARSVSSALRSRGAKVVLAGRSLRRALEAAGPVGAGAAGLSSASSILARSSILINCIPSLDPAILPERSLRPGLVVVDLDCSPAASGILGRAAERGAHTVGGTDVLVSNLARAMRLFTGERPPRRLVEALLEESEGGAPQRIGNPPRDQNY